jgi:hypothetical protein
VEDVDKRGHDEDFGFVVEDGGLVNSGTGELEDEIM